MQDFENFRSSRQEKVSMKPDPSKTAEKFLSFKRNNGIYSDHSSSTCPTKSCKYSCIGENEKCCCTYSQYSTQCCSSVSSTADDNESSSTQQASLNTDPSRTLSDEASTSSSDSILAAGGSGASVQERPLLGTHRDKDHLSNKIFLPSFKMKQRQNLQRPNSFFQTTKTPFFLTSSRSNPSIYEPYHQPPPHKMPIRAKVPNIPEGSMQSFNLFEPGTCWSSEREMHHRRRHSGHETNCDEGVLLPSFKRQSANTMIDQSIYENYADVRQNIHPKRPTFPPPIIPIPNRLTKTKINKVENKTQFYTLPLETSM